MKRVLFVLLIALLLLGCASKEDIVELSKNVTKTVVNTAQEEMQNNQTPPQPAPNPAFANGSKVTYAGGVKASNLPRVQGIEVATLVFYPVEPFDLDNYSINDCVVLCEDLEASIKVYADWLKETAQESNAEAQACYAEAVVLEAEGEELLEQIPTDPFPDLLVQPSMPVFGSVSYCYGGVYPLSAFCEVVPTSLRNAKHALEDVYKNSDRTCAARDKVAEAKAELQAVADSNASLYDYYKAYRLEELQCLLEETEDYAHCTEQTRAEVEHYADNVINYNFTSLESECSSEYSFCYPTCGQTPQLAIEQINYHIQDYNALAKHLNYSASKP